MSQETGDGGGSSRESDPGSILAPAPVLAIGAFLVGAVPHLVWPIAVVPAPWHLVAGVMLVGIGGGVLVSGLRAMRRADTAPPHEEEPPTIVTDGPFAYTRNPLYLGVCVVYLGATMLLNSLWPLVPLVALAMYFDGVARREEAYLEAAFGEEYAQYRETVRRWL